jgi:acetylornithine deacetylase/succinyl-diaminopimelate desuccinylase family protein
MDSDTAAAITAAVEDLQAEAVSVLTDLVRTPSPNPPGAYDDVVSLLVETYESYGWDIDVVDPPKELLDAHGISRPRPNVLATVTEGEGPTIVLNAHFDTVPVDESKWEHDPFEAVVEDGRLYGRGATDSKGRIASYTLAARALEAADLLPEDATVILAITADEESGGHAGAGYIAEAVLAADYAIVEGSSEAIWHAACGVLHFRVTVEGEAAHAGNPDNGENAIRPATRVLTALFEHADDLAARESEVEGVAGPTCTPGTISGGTKTNVVPATCSFTVDRRVPPDEDIEDAEAAVRAVVADAAGDASVEVERILRARPYRFEQNDPHVRAVSESAAALLDRDVPVKGTQGFTDARFFARAGADCVHFGPGDGDSNTHGADESVALAQVRDAGAVVAASVRAMADYS